MACFVAVSGREALTQKTGSIYAKTDTPERHPFRASRAIQWTTLTRLILFMTVTLPIASISLIATMTRPPRCALGNHRLEGDELRFLRALRRQNPHADFVFLSERKAPLSVDGAQKLIERLGEAAKLPFPIHAHVLRHAAGYALAGRPSWGIAQSRTLSFIRRSRQAHPQHLGQTSKVRSGQLKRDRGNGSRSTLHRRKNNHCCSLQFDRCDSANPHDGGP